MAILIVDDDADVLAALARALRESGDGWDVRKAVTAKQALGLVGADDVECVLLDYKLPDTRGLECLHEIRRLRPDVPVVLVTGSGSEAVAVDAMKAGAADYVVKHGTYAHAVPGVVREALGRRALASLAADGADDGRARRELPPLDAETRARFDADGFVARSPAMLRVLGLIARAADSTSTVLIEGESGTGKELCARALHAHGSRFARPFLAQSCAAMTEALLESELFGHVRGAFTGADRTHAGVFERADGGTLFLDEIGEASLATQAKLLRVLQEREFVPVGGTAPRRVDVRVVAATNRDLRREVDAGRFRLDLYYRLRQFPIVVPALRERSHDVVPLAEHFLARAAQAEKKPIAGFAPETLAVLERFAWPGNVRELENEVRRLVVCAEPGDTIPPDALPPAIVNAVLAAPETDVPLQKLMRQIETTIVQSRLRKHNYSRKETARSLGLTRESLWAKMRALGLLPRKK